MISKKIIGIILLLIIGLAAVQAQSTTTINYSYDAAGNRILRTITVSQIKQQPNTGSDTSTIVSSIKHIIDADKTNTTTNAATDSINSSKSNTLTIETGEIKVYPNPVTEKVNVQFIGTANAEGSSLQIYDGLSKLFLNKEALQQQNEINMQQAKKGAYFMVVITKDGKRQYWKLVKE